MDEGGERHPYHAEAENLIPKVAQSLKEMEKSPNYYDLVKLTSSQQKYMNNEHI